MEPFNPSTVRPTGSAAARITRLPLLSALNQLLNPHGISVASQDGVLMFRHGGRIGGDAPGPPPSENAEDEPPNGGAGGQTLCQDVSLRHPAAAGPGEPVGGPLWRGRGRR